jgi:hypothetical protein
MFAVETYAHLVVSGNLSSTLAFSLDQAEGSITALAVAICSGLHRGARHRFALSGPRKSECA